MEAYELAALAIEAKKMSYSPYSGFKVGAALLARSGRVFMGTNVECASYSATNCAERTAVFKAVSEGERDFSAIAVAGGYDNTDPGYCYPCGVCRQVLFEFCDAETFKVYVVKDNDNYKEYLLKELLPFGFGPESLGE